MSEMCLVQDIRKMILFFSAFVFWMPGHNSHELRRDLHRRMMQCDTRPIHIFLI